MSTDPWWFSLVVTLVTVLLWVVIAGTVTEFLTRRTRRILAGAMITLLIGASAVSYAYAVLTPGTYGVAERPCLGAPYENCG